jgi:hypothetical protein
VDRVAQSSHFVVEEQWRVPPIGCAVSPEVFDAYAWNTSSTVRIRRPSTLARAPLFSEDNPSEMGFVVSERGNFLPREDATLHFPDLCTPGESLLAPYAIDDATDELYAHNVPADTCMVLVSRSVRGLFWGLHDWAHFHNHGPFENVPETELQCDLAALAWMKLNRELWNAADHELETLAQAVFTHARTRFGGAFPLALRALDPYSD